MEFSPQDNVTCTHAHCRHRRKTWLERIAEEVFKFSFREKSFFLVAIIEIWMERRRRGSQVSCQASVKASKVVGERR